MLAAYAARTDRENPLAALEVGDLPPPEPPPGWALVRVAAASPNHHDLWTLRGISSRPVEPPQILGCDAAGMVAGYGPDRPDDAPAEGTRVVAHSGIGCGACAACRDAEPLFCRGFGMLSEGGYQGTLAQDLPVPAGPPIPPPHPRGFVDPPRLPPPDPTASPL